MIDQFKYKVINHVLKQNDWVPSFLKAHSNKSILILIGPMTFSFKVNDKAMLELVDEVEGHYTKIIFSLDAFFKLIIKKEKNNIKVEGDLDFANDFSKVLEQIEWDAESDLAKIFGDVVGYEIYKAGQSFIHQTKKNIINLAETTIEFWQEENKILSKKNQIQSFLNQVDQIAGDVERFEARLNFYIESKKS